MADLPTIAGSVRERSPHLVVGFGAGLLLVSLVHHATELRAVEGSVGPLVAAVLDGLPALALVYAGYRLSGTDLVPEDRWRVCLRCFAGAALFGSVMALSLLVRAFEGRPVGEPVFPVLIAVEAGGIAGVIAGYTTARARTEARRARTANDALGFVNSLIRHDLRNDLDVIQGRAELIDADADSADTETLSESASVIAEKADEALVRIETTGEVAKTLTGDPDFERVDLAAVTAEVATRAGNTHDLPVTTSLPEEAPVIANAGLRSVLDNLIENAVEHNDSDEPRVHVELETDTETVRLSVADNGPGIPDGRTESVFRPRSEGTGGGGLSLVQTLVDGYGGEVWVEDNEPSGAVFTVELPRADDERQ